MRPNSEGVQSNFIRRTLKGFNRIAPGRVWTWAQKDHRP